MQQRQWMTSQEHLNRLKRNALKQRQQLQTMAAVESRIKKTTTAQSTNVATQKLSTQKSSVKFIMLFNIQESYGLWSSVCDPAVEIIGKNREVLVQVLGALYIRGGGALIEFVWSYDCTRWDFCSETASVRTSSMSRVRFFLRALQGRLAVNDDFVVCQRTVLSCSLHGRPCAVNR